MNNDRVFGDLFLARHYEESAVSPFEKLMIAINTIGGLGLAIGLIALWRKKHGLPY